MHLNAIPSTFLYIERDRFEEEEEDPTRTWPREAQ
jgi:hypothetical protein